MEIRQLKGLEIASNHEFTREGNIWSVPSQSSNKRYAVNPFIQTCSCADFEAHRQKCKHIHAVEFLLQKESNLPLPEPEKVVRPTYKQEWHAYNLAQTNEKAKFQELLYGLCRQIEEPMQHMGRPRVSIADRIYAAAFKSYSLLSGRRFTSDLMEAKRRGYLSMMPHYNSIFRYLESEELTPYLKALIVESSLPLKCVEFDFAVDSSGFSTGLYRRWVETKWDKSQRKYGENTSHIQIKDWVKVHAMIGVKTNVITAVEISDARAGDSPYFRPLVETTSSNFVMNEVSADMAYSADKNLKLVLLKGAQPYIPFKSNTNITEKSPSVWKRLYHYFMYNQEEFMRHYHKRSNVEATFNMVKAKFGERLRSKTDVAQKNEVLCKILCHNICCLIQSMYELGIEVAFDPTENQQQKP